MLSANHCGRSVHRGGHRPVQAGHHHRRLEVPQREDLPAGLSATCIPDNLKVLSIMCINNGEIFKFKVPHKVLSS